MKSAIHMLCSLLAATAVSACGPGAVEPPTRVTSRTGSTSAPSPPALLAIHGTRPGPVLLALHDNENDAVLAARAFVDTHGGRVVEVRAHGQRDVTLMRDGRRIAFDPNRVFTDAGLRATLADRGTRVDAASIGAARAFADDVLRNIDMHTATLVIAVHNNTDGAYSAASYAPGASLARDAAAVHLPRGADPDHFFFVTTRVLFDALVPSGYPVVLQENARAADDGSLSVLCARRGVAYVNVEAQHGRADVQRAMLEALHRAGIATRR